MCLKKLHLLNFRSFKDFLLPIENSALIYGDNGAGKTSILEGIHFALKAKSFRTTSINSMINKDADFFRISSDIYDCKRALEKRTGKALIKENYDSFDKYDLLPLLINNFL
jgi:Recombinational DNA repair ATPase (RecF pathway)